MNAIILSLISWFVFLINPPIGLGSLVILIETGLYGLMEYRIKKADDSEKDTLYNAYFILSVMVVVVTSVIMLFLYQLRLFMMKEINGYIVMVEENCMITLILRE